MAQALDYLPVAERFDGLRERYLPAILQLIESGVRAATPEGSELRALCEYHMGTGGKRLRALLPLLVAETMGEDPAMVLPFAAACEMLHNATLVHDDLQDGDRTRRGRETVWARFGAARAINLGDAMFYFAPLLLQRLAAMPAQRERAVERMLRETIRVIDGQDQELLLKAVQRPTVADYFRMVEGKTSGLFALPMTGAAELCGAESETLRALDEAARHLGVLFQVQDDLLDLYGDKGRTMRGSDIAEGKRSVLMVHALSTLGADEASWLAGVVDRDRAQTTPEEIEEAAELLQRCGAQRFALDEIRRREAAALCAVSSPDGEATLFRALIEGIAALFLQPIAQLAAN